MPLSDGLPPLSTKGTIRVDVLGAPIGKGWGVALWGVDVWAGRVWTDATPQSISAIVSWGANDNQGALSLSSAGSWSAVTYDPDRKLDPANTGSPLFGYLVPGTPVRILYYHAPTGAWESVRTGFIDEIEFDMATRQGSIRATDGISIMAKAKVPEYPAQDAPYSLRARARWALAQAGVNYIQVEADPAGDVDPAVGAVLPGQSVWQNIATAAYDALNAVWIDRKGILKFRYFGNPIISLVALGGAADHSIPIDTLLTRVSMESVYNHVQAFRDSPLRDPVMVEAKTPSSIAEYGDLLLTRERLNPTADVFVQQLLLDRGASALQHEVGTIRPQTPDQFLQLISLGMSTLVQIRVSSKHGTPINEFASVLGGTIEANTDSGWSVRLATYQPGSQWQDEPKTVIRAYNTNKSLEIWTILGDATNYGQSNKAQGEIQASKRTATGDEKHDVMLDFPPLNWAGVTRIEKAVLRFHRPYHQDVEGGIEEGIYIKARRITAAWTENDKWPAPANTNLEEVAYYCDHTLGEWEEMDVTRIVRAWAPSHVEGGGSQVQYGIGLFTYYDQLGASYPPQHIIIDMKLSSTPAYLYLKLE